MCFISAKVKRLRLMFQFCKLLGVLGYFWSVVSPWSGARVDSLSNHSGTAAANTSSTADTISAEPALPNWANQAINMSFNNYNRQTIQSNSYISNSNIYAGFCLHIKFSTCSRLERDLKNSKNGCLLFHRANITYSYIAYQ